MRATPSPALRASTMDIATVATAEPHQGGVPDVDREAEGEEEQGGERIPQGEHEPLDPPGQAVAASMRPAMKAPMASETPRSKATPAISRAKPTKRPPAARRRGRDRRADDPCAEAGDEAQRDQEGQAAAKSTTASPAPSASPSTGASAAR